MKKYLCTVCGYVYDPSENNNIEFNDLSDDWTCPICQASKDEFEEVS